MSDIKTAAPVNIYNIECNKMNLLWLYILVFMIGFIIGSITISIIVIATPDFWNILKCIPICGMRH